jgi:hypothetical protein
MWDDQRHGRREGGGREGGHRHVDPAERRLSGPEDAKHAKQQADAARDENLAEPATDEPGCGSRRESEGHDGHGGAVRWRGRDNPVDPARPDGRREPALHNVLEDLRHIRQLAEVHFPWLDTNQVGALGFEFAEGSHDGGWGREELGLQLQPPGDMRQDLFQLVRRVAVVMHRLGEAEDEAAGLEGVGSGCW